MPPVEILAALVGVGGVCIGAIVQWLVARNALRAETQRLYAQLREEFHLQQFSAWQSQFQSVISDLLAATDPEANERLEKQRIIPLVLKAQLMLNPQLPPHAKVNDLVNKLALAVHDWHEDQDPRSVLTVHAALLDAARDSLYRPGAL